MNPSAPIWKGVYPWCTSGVSGPRTYRLYILGPDTRLVPEYVSRIQRGEEGPLGVVSSLLRVICSGEAGGIMDSGVVNVVNRLLLYVPTWGIMKPGES